jgi:hypothetical protein
MREKKIIEEKSRKSRGYNTGALLIKFAVFAARKRK